jgi:hypothetical protein
VQLSMLPGILSFWWAADLLASVFNVEGGTETLAAAAAGSTPPSPSAGSGGGRINQFGASMRRRATSFVDWARSEPLISAAARFASGFCFHLLDVSAATRSGCTAPTSLSCMLLCVYASRAIRFTRVIL